MSAAAGARESAREAARERLAGYLAGSGSQRHLVYVAAKLGLADLLVDRPRSAGDLAAAVGAHADTLRRVMRGMVAIGLLVEHGDGSFGLDEMGQLLRNDAPEALRGRVIKNAELGFAWGGLLHAVLTGENAFEHVFGEGAFAHFARDPVTHPHLNPGTSWELAQTIASSYDFAPFETVVDVGGGNGIVLAAILQRYPHLRGAVLDQAHLIPQARQTVEQLNVAARCQLVAGDFFEAVPAGDLYVLKTILHDWDDTRAARILEQCRKAMRPHGRILVVERPLPERAVDGAPGFRGDVMMLVETGGRERTPAEYRALFGATGLTLASIQPLQAEWHLMEGLTA